MAGIDFTGGGPPMASILIDKDWEKQNSLPAEVPFAMQSVVEQSQWAGFASQINARFASELEECRTPCLRTLRALGISGWFLRIAVVAFTVFWVGMTQGMMALPAGINPFAPLFTIMFLCLAVSLIEACARMAVLAKSLEEINQICDQSSARIPNVTLAVIDPFRKLQARLGPQVNSFRACIIPLSLIQVTDRGGQLTLLAQGPGIVQTAAGMWGMEDAPQQMTQMQMQPQQQQLLGMGGAGQMQMPLQQQQQQQQFPGFPGFQQQQPGFTGMAGMQQPGLAGIPGMGGFAQNPMQQPGLPGLQQQQQQQQGFSGY